MNRFCSTVIFFEQNIINFLKIANERIYKKLHKSAGFGPKKDLLTPI